MGCAFLALYHLSVEDLHLFMFVRGVSIVGVLLIEIKTVTKHTRTSWYLIRVIQRSCPADVITNQLVAVGVVFL